MINKINSLFEKEKGKAVYDNAVCAIKDHSMQELIKGGVLLGLSGGADSVMLLLTLYKIKQDMFDFPLIAVHINHMIRGKEADRDEDFCKRLCAEVGCELYSYRIDVPTIANERRKGLEETARDVRYAKFGEILDSRTDISCIAVAHNSTDNLETIVFNMMRGAGIAGLSGIKPVRDNIIRPLIYSSKKSITDALASDNIEYVTDSTNLTNDYTRNYIRNVILPSFERLTPNPEQMGTRVSLNLLSDMEMIDEFTNTFLSQNYIESKIEKSKLESLNKSAFHRILAEIARQKSNTAIERIHSDAVYSLLSKDRFSYSLPGGVRFCVANGYAFIENETDQVKAEPMYVRLKSGVNEIPGYSNVVILSSDPHTENYSNIYRIEIQKAIPSDIINAGLYVRRREDGDSYSYGGITRKLKKLFNDRKIDTSDRENIPVFCDSEGIVWVPGFGVRNEENKQIKSYITIASPINSDEGNKNKLYILKR